MIFLASNGEIIGLNVSQTFSIRIDSPFSTADDKI
jgi:hypothetical protein